MEEISGIQEFCFCRELARRGLPVRIVLLILIFFGTFSTYILYVNLSIAIVGMVKQHSPIIQIDKNCPQFNHTYIEQSGPLSWGEAVQGYILAAFFGLYPISQMFGYILVERVGPKKIIVMSMSVSVAVTLATPIAATTHLSILIVLRIVLGILVGLMFPGFHCFIAQWVPIKERAKHIWCLLGGTIGIIVSWPLYGLIIIYLSWKEVFYITGGAVAIWTFAWIFLVTDSPSQHPNISEDELEYINRNIATGREVHSKVPWKKVFRSRPFLVLLLLHFCNVWGLNFALLSVPKYFHEALGHGVALSGFMGTLPFIARFITGYVFDIFGIYVHKKGIANIKQIRRVFTVFSHLFPGCAMLILIFTECKKYLPVGLLISALGFNGAAVGGVLANIQDLAPNYAGTLFRLINTVGTLSGLIVPIMVGHVCEKHTGFSGWNIVFTINCAIYMFGGIMYLLFGCAEVQPWNSPVRQTNQNMNSNET